MFLFAITADWIFLSVDIGRRARGGGLGRRREVVSCHFNRLLAQQHAQQPNEGDQRRGWRADGDEAGGVASGKVVS